MRTRHAALLALLTTAACAATVALAADRKALTPASQPTTTLTPADRPIPEIRRVLIISIDGCRPDLLARADVPHIRALMRAGSFTMWARTTALSRTLPSHFSMLTGVPPQVHEIEWNRDLPLAKPVYPKGRTLFDIARQYGYTTALAAGKSKFDLFDRPGALDWSWMPGKKSATTQTTTKPAATEPAETEEWPEDAKKVGKEVPDAVVAGHAARIIREHQPQVMLVHLPNVDYTGHSIGWGSHEQIRAVERADDAVGQVLWALGEAGVRSSTLVILTADHGGAGNTHGPDDARSRHIPWIAAGPGVRADADLTRYPALDVNTEDTFATACYALGMRPSARITGKPIKEIVARDELLQAAK